MVPKGKKAVQPIKAAGQARKQENKANPAPRPGSSQVPAKPGLPAGAPGKANVRARLLQTPKPG